jgi:hypothetical protein
MIWWERKKTVPVNELDDFLVTLRQLNGRNRGDTLKARKSGHPTSMSEHQKIKRPVNLSILASSQRLLSLKSDK